MKTALSGYYLKLKSLCFSFNLIFTTTLLVFFCVSANADLKLEFDAGMEYDSNVATDAADSNAGLGDVARNFSLGLGYDYRINQSWNLSSSYRLNDTQWYTYNEFGNQMHIGLFRIGYQQKKISSDVSLIHAYGSVDGKDFLSLNRISPAVGYLMHADWYIRAQSDFSQKSFAQYEQRDGDSIAASLYLYRFIDRTRFYINAQAQWKNEDSEDDVYAYQATILKLQLKRDWHLFSYKLTSRIQGRFDKRHYKGIRTSINATRADSRWSLSLKTHLNITKHWQINSSLQSDWFNSNVDAANYNQERIMFGVGWEF